MDSGNSGSLQSSDDEYDSRVFMSGSGNPIPHAPPQFLDPLSGYLQLHQNPMPSLFNSPNPLIRSDPNPNQLTDSMFPTPPPPCLQHHPTAASNPKKRSRASRRAPTTVLTTDTSNFRAMVQEFTGIPAPPFRSTAQPPPYLRRPSVNQHLPNLFTIPNQNKNILTSLFPFSTASKPQNSFQKDNDRFSLCHQNQVSETLPNLIPFDHNHNDFQRNAVGGKISNLSSFTSSSRAKSPENNVRGEGMVESWICSSD